VSEYTPPSVPAVLAERAQRLQKFRASAPAEQAQVLAFYRDHPAQFITDWGMTFDPRNVEIGLPASIPFLLFPRQIEFVDWTYERWRCREPGLADKSRDMGVSWLIAAIAVHMWIFYGGTIVAFGSRKEELVDGDPKSLLWKVRYLIAHLPRDFRPAGYDERKHSQKMRITNPVNGSVINGESGDNIGRGARASLYFVDEAAFLEQPDKIEAALSQATNCQIDVSTPNGSGNPFYRKRHSGRVSVFTLHWRDDPRKDAAWYAKQVAELDPIVVAAEIDINYEASVSNAWIDGALVEAAFHRGPADVEAIGLKILGVDAAHFGDDTSVVTYRRGRLVTPQWVFKGQLDGVELAARVIAIADDLGGVDQIVIELDGPGVSCHDQLRQSDKYRSRVKGVHTGARRGSDGKHYNLRAQMWARLKEWLQEEPNVLPRCGELKAELTAMKYAYKDGLLLMEKKSEFKKHVHRSPDRADSLALTFAHMDAAPPRPAFTPHQRHGAASWML